MKSEKRKAKNKSEKREPRGTHPVDGSEHRAPKTENRKRRTENRKQWRRRKGLTQMQLSRRSGLTQSAISNIENQGRHINTRSLSRLSRGLNLSLARLFSLPRNRPLPQGRRRIDRLARCIVDGRFAGNPADDRLCRDIGSLIINKLRAHEKEGRKRYRAKRWNVLSRYLLMKEKYSPWLVRQILTRIDKLL